MASIKANLGYGYVNWQKSAYDERD